MPFIYSAADTIVILSGIDSLIIHILADDSPDRTYD